MGRGSHAKELPPWFGALIATMPALFCVFAVEAGRILWAFSGNVTLSRVVGTIAEVATQGGAQLSALLVLALAQSLVLAKGRVGQARWPLWLALLALSAAMSFVVWQVAAQAPALRRSLVVTLAFVLLAVGHGLLLMWLTVPGKARALRVWVGAALIVGSLGAASAHYQMLVGLYPTLHSSVAMVSFVGIHLGTALALVGQKLSFRSGGPLVLLPAAAVLAALLAPAQVRARGRPYVAAQSALVRPVVIAQTPEELLRPAAPPQRKAQGPMRPDEAALARFAKSSNMPPLPAQFRLEDYNILYVIIDAARYDRTTLADPTLKTTKNLAALVRDGAFTFARATSPSNGTFPTLAAMLSMCPLSFVRLEIHARHWHGKLHRDQPTAPEALGRAGYETFWVGHDFKRVMTIRVHGVQERFMRHHLELVFPHKNLDADARIAGEAIRQVRRARAARKRFFGLVFFASPHDDYQVHRKSWPSETPLERYDQELWYADKQLGRLLREISRGGGLEKTIIVVTGDHGEAFGERGHRYHLSSLYPEQVQVPLAVWIPGIKGHKVEEPTSNLYVLPWLLLKGPAPARQAAEKALREDLGPMLRQTKGAVLSELVSRNRQEAALRYDDYTVYYDLLAGFFRVFDPHADPGELRDIREERPDLVKRFTPLVEAYRQARFAGQRYHFAPPEAYEHYSPP